MSAGGRTVLSIGSNVGDRLAHLRSVTDAVAADVLAVSAVYETPPWGGVEQKEFLNAVVTVSRPGCDAHGWLRVAHALERAAGRTRGPRFGPRTLDVDVVEHRDERGPLVLGGAELTLPHPRAHERAFVLVPWLEIEPDAVLTGRGRVEACLARLPAGDVEGVCRRPEILCSP